MLQICGISFILGFTFANSTVFLNLTLLHIPNKYADGLFLLCLPLDFQKQRNAQYCPVSFSAWHITRQLEPRTGLTSLPLATMHFCVLIFTMAVFLVGCVADLLFSFVFFLSCMQREQLEKAFFSMSRRIVSILHNPSPFSVSLH